MDTLTNKAGAQDAIDGVSRLQRSLSINPIMWLSLCGLEEARLAVWILADHSQSLIVPLSSYLRP
jgi:hypothetical protein